MGRVCICIPTYNAEQTIGETLQSLLVQDYPDLIIKVVDNASTDKTLAVVSNFNDPRVSIYRSDENIGAEPNFTRCISLAEGDYTAIYHADDIYEPDMVRRQVEFLNAHSEACAVFTEAMKIDEYGRPIGWLRVPNDKDMNKEVLDFNNLFRSILKHSNFLICPSAMARTQTYRDVIGAWRGDLFGSSADLDVWLRFAKYGAIGLIREPLMRYRVSQYQGSQTLCRLRTERADFFRVVDYYNTHSPELFLTKSSNKHYLRLQRTDRLVRAVNLIRLGRIKEAAKLSADVISADAWLAAMTSRRGLMTLTGWMYLKTMMGLQLNQVLKTSLDRLAKALGR